MATGAFAGIGASFQREGDLSSGTYHDLGEVTSIKPPNKSAKTIDATTLKSPGGYGEYIVGMKDSGEAGFTANFTLTDYNIINDDFEERAAHDYQIVFPDTGGTTFAFSGVVTGLDMDNITPEGLVQFTCTIKITGPVTMTT